MRAPIRLALAGAFGLALTTAAAATDLFVDVAQPTPIAEQFDWEGLYIGFDKDLWIGEAFGFHGVAGYNFVLSDRFVAGIEGRAGMALDPPSSFSAFDGTVGVRLGALLSDRVLIYKRADIGIVDDDAYYALGGGLELAIGDSTSLRGEVEGIGQLGSPISVVAVSAAMLWHLN